jgi:hypothetical protein
METQLGAGEIRVEERIGRLEALLPATFDGDRFVSCHSNHPPVVHESGACCQHKKQSRCQQRQSREETKQAMRVFYCKPSNRPDRIGASPDVGEVLELARALMSQPGTQQGLSVQLRVGEMSKAEFAASQLFPLDQQPGAQFGTAQFAANVATALVTE